MSINSSNNTHELHPEAATFLQALYGGDEPKSIETLQPSAVREMMLTMSVAIGGDATFDGTREEILVPQEAAMPVPCWVYRPSSAAGKPNPCICVFFHGGGWVFSSRLTYDVACKNLADRGACIVVSVEYRLAPEHKSPACYEDGTTVVQWALQNKTVLGGSDASLVGVAGDSAGGNIAASLCHTVPGIAFQVLIYPVMDLTGSHPSMKEFGHGYVVTAAGLEWSYKHFLSSDDEKTDVLVSPLFHQSFTDLPPALLLITMCDPLRDEGLAYSAKLENAGVPVQVIRLNGLVHGFFNQAAAYPESCREAYEAVGQFLQKF